MKYKWITLANWIHLLSIALFFSVAISQNLLTGLLAGLTMELLSWFLLKTIPLIWKGIIWIIPIIYMTIMLLICVIVWIFTLNGRIYDDEENGWPYY